MELAWFAGAVGSRAVAAPADPLRAEGAQRPMRTAAFMHVRARVPGIADEGRPRASCGAVAPPPRQP